MVYGPSYGFLARIVESGVTDVAENTLWSTICPAADARICGNVWSSPDLSRNNTVAGLTAATLASLYSSEDGPTELAIFNWRWKLKATSVEVSESPLANLRPGFSTT